VPLAGSNLQYYFSASFVFTGIALVQSTVQFQLVDSVTGVVCGGGDTRTLLGAAGTVSFSSQRNGVTAASRTVALQYRVLNGLLGAISIRPVTNPGSEGAEIIINNMAV
jgi:hypothetical protein